MCRWLLKLCKEGNSSTSLDNLCLCSVTLMVKQCFLMFRQHVLCFGLYSLPLVLSPNTIEKSLALSSSRPSIRYLYTLLDPPQVIFPLGYTVLPQPIISHIHTLNSFGWPACSHRQMEQRCSLHLGPQFSSISTRETLHRNGLQCMLLLTNNPSF